VAVRVEARDGADVVASVAARRAKPARRTRIAVVSPAHAMPTDADRRAIARQRLAAVLARLPNRAEKPMTTEPKVSRVAPTMSRDFRPPTSEEDQEGVTSAASPTTTAIHKQAVAASKRIIALYDRKTRPPLGPQNTAKFLLIFRAS
jgi:hypothetical protein